MLNSHPRRPLLVAFAVFLFAAVVAAALIWRSDQDARREWRARVFNLASARAGGLQRSIEHDLSAVYALAALVRQGRGTIPNFDAVASQMLPFYPGVAELALAPGGIIRNVVPLAGNERALGYNILHDPATAKEALLARDTGKLTLAGPLNLVQGGLGVVGRLPVFLEDAEGKPSFWGFTMVMMRFPEALEAVKLPQLAGLGFAYELWRIHPDTGQKQIIAASSSAAPIEPVASTLQVPNATWTLSVAPLGGWGDPLKLALKVVLGLLFSLLLAYLAKLLLELRAHRDGLETLVGERTAEVRAREADLNHAQSLARVGSWTLDLATKEMRGSAQAMRIFGISDVVPFNYRTFLERVHPDDRDAVDRASRAALKGDPYDIDFRILAGAATRWVHSQAELAFDADGRLYRALGTVQDITERKQAEDALRASEARYRELFEANPHPMWVWDTQTLGFLAVNDEAVAHYGYSRDEFLAMLVTDIRPPEEVPRLLRRVAQVQKQDSRDGGIWRHRRKDGALIDVEITSHTLVFGGRRAQIVLANDVTDRLQAERKLRESEARFRSLTEMSSDFYWESDTEHRLTLLSAGGGEDAAQVLPQGSPLGRRRWEMPYLTPDEAGWEAHRAVLGAHRPFRDFELSRLGIDGVTRHIAISGDPVFDASGAFRGYRGVGKQISGRKAAEAKIARLTQLYAALSQCNQAIVRCASEEELLQQICRVAVVFGGMKMAWIGLVDPDTRMIRFAARYGDRVDEYLQGVEISVDPDSPFGRGPTGIAIRENRPYWCQDFHQQPPTAPWHERRARFGWVASASLPLHMAGVPIGVLSLYASEAGAFDEAISELLIEMAADISFALGNFARESARQRAEEALRESEERYRGLTELSSDWYWEQDENLRFTRMSKPNAGQQEIELDTFLGKTRREAKDVVWDESRLAALDAMVAARQPFRDFEIGRTYRNGPKRYVQMSGEPKFDASGRFAGYRGVGKDITERKEREEDLRRFRAAMDATAEAIYLVDRTSLRFIDVNAAACAMLGLAREEIFALGPEGVLSMPREALARIYDSVIAGGPGTEPAEMLRRRKSGEEAWVEFRRRAQRSGAGWMIVTVVRDITERKRAERALEESEARFRSLTEMSSDFYWETDAEHRLVARTSANRKLSTVSAFQRGAQIGERRWEIPYLSPDEAGWQAHRAVLDAHLPFRDFELSRLGADGTERHISISGDPVFDASGAFKGYRGVGTDITGRKRAERALKESEQRLRLALNSARMAAWEWNVGPDTLVWSEPPVWLIGAEPAAGYPDFRELVHPDDRAGFLEAGRQAISRGTDYHAVFRITRTDGLVRWVEAQGVFFDTGESERGKRIIGVSQDITERKQNADDLQRLNEELEQRVAERTHALEIVNNELEAFSYSVSHDLRAPLRAIQGYSRLVEEEYASRMDEQGRNMLKRVGVGAQKMGLLIDDLLRLSRISRQSMQIGPVDLSALVREVADELRSGEPERRVEWVIAPQVSAQGDPGLLRVVLQNLLGNAWKYSSGREVARIEFGVGEKDGRSAYFVRDNGAGFDMAHARKLFVPFQRLHSEAEFPGSGIGLATVARILHRHGGEAWAQAHAGEGATFYFSLG